MDEEDSVRNEVFKDISPCTLPDLHLPSLDPILASHHAELQRHQASDELGIKQMFAKQRKWKIEMEWDDLARDKEELKKLFLDSNKAIKENKASISRFFEIIREQRAHRQKLDREILYTSIDIEEYKKVKETMEKYVKQYSIFEDFLEDVASESKTGDFLSVREILNRYETLEGTRAALTKMLKAEMEAEAQIRKQMIELLEMSSAALKTQSNRLIMLQVSGRQAQDRRTYWEMVVQRIKNMVLGRQEENVVLRGACWDLYNEICTRRRVPPSAPMHDMAAQLDYIQKSIVFYKEVLTMATGPMAGGGRRQMGQNIMKKKKM